MAERWITYTPTRDNKLLREFYSRNVRPLGTPRYATVGNQKSGLGVRCNAAGAMELFRILVQVASERKGGWEFLPRERLGDGTWAGDSEPGSTPFGVWLDESAGFRPIRVLECRIPSAEISRGKLGFVWSASAHLRLELSGSAENPMFGILGNQEALIAVATHLATLSLDDVLPGTLARYRPGKELASSSIPLFFEKHAFDGGNPPSNPRC